MAKKPDPKKVEVANSQKKCKDAGGFWDVKAKKCVLPDKKIVDKIRNEKECELAGGTWDPKAKKCIFEK